MAAATPSVDRGTATKLATEASQRESDTTSLDRDGAPDVAPDVATDVAEVSAPATDSAPIVDTRSLAQADQIRGERLTSVAPKPSARPPSRSPVKPAVRTTRPARTAKPARGHHGRNHVWSASLGLDRSVSWFPCSRASAPGPVVYRWGCAGANNVYLFAHAGGPFQRLHDLYVRGSLRKGMAVTYADAAGRVHRYAIAWWKVVLPTEGDFAFAAQSRPSMTLQTCVGPHDRDRLIVRLYLAD